MATGDMVHTQRVRWLLIPDIDFNLISTIGKNVASILVFTAHFSIVIVHFVVVQVFTSSSSSSSFYSVICFAHFGELSCRLQRKKLQKVSLTYLPASGPWNRWRWDLHDGWRPRISSADVSRQFRDFRYPSAPIKQNKFITITNAINQSINRIGKIC